MTTEPDRASIAAHQLRGPLAVMRGVLETLARHASLEDDFRAQLLERGLAASYRQEHVIEALLEPPTSSRPRRPTDQRRGFVAEAVDLAPAIERVLSESLTPEDRERVRMDLPLELRVAVDPMALDCIVSNLVSNAVNYTSVDTAVDVVGRIGDGGDAVMVTVADEGPGIAPEDQERIFEPFERSSRVAGVGLGLAIARWAVEASGGRIWVESREGDGARFCFTLPRAS